MSNERARSPPNGGCLNVNHRLNHSLKKELQSHLQSVLSLHHDNLKLLVETKFKGFFSYFKLLYKSKMTTAGEKS